MNIPEQFYTDTIAGKLKSIYGNRSQLLTRITDMFKTISQSVDKQTWEKNDAEILEEIMKSSFNLGDSLEISNSVKSSISEIKQAEHATQLLNQQLVMTPIFIDFCYIWYCTFFDIDCPFHKLPSSLIKFKIIMRSLISTIKPSSAVINQIGDINSIFELIIENTFFKDLRFDEVPFQLRTELTQADIKDKMSIVVVPMLKDLLNTLMKLESKDHTDNTNQTTNDTTSLTTSQITQSTDEFVLVETTSNQSDQPEGQDIIQDIIDQVD